MKRIYKIIIYFLAITFLFVIFYPVRNKTKILLIGLDGADWKVINPLLKQGKLPNLKFLMDNGCWGNLRSFYPLYSETIWTTILTGKAPIKHGITTQLIEDPQTHESILWTSNLIKTKRIWNILSERGKKVCVISHKITWPPEEVNGILISDRLDLSDYFQKDYSFPELKNIISEADFNKFTELKNGITSKLDKNLYKLDYETEVRDNFTFNITNYFLKNQKFDFITLYISGIDFVSHHFWKYLFPEGWQIDKDEELLFKDIINDYYIFCDKAIGELIKRMDKNTTVIIVSDHGFTNIKIPEEIYTFNVNLILKLCGLDRIIKNNKIISIKQFIHASPAVSAPVFLRIHGELNENELEEIKKYAISVLENIKIKEIQMPLFKILKYKIDELTLKINYPYLFINPQYHILIDGKEYKIADFLPLISEVPQSGNHYPIGIIILSGKHIINKKLIEGSTIYDITPTILYLMGFPLGKDMPGKVLVQAIKDDFLRKNPLRYIETYEKPKIKKPLKPIRMPKDEEKIKEMMRALGYLQ